jgi:hypothetical protein
MRTSALWSLMRGHLEREERRSGESDVRAIHFTFSAVDRKCRASNKRCDQEG